MVRTALPEPSPRVLFLRTNFPLLADGYASVIANAARFVEARVKIHAITRASDATYERETIDVFDLKSCLNPLTERFRAALQEP